MGCSASVPTVSSLNAHPLTSSSSPPTAPPKTLEIAKRDRRRIEPQELIQNFLLLWLDAYIDESTDDFRNSMKQLRRTVNTIETFQDTDECINFITKLENKKVFLIISGALCQTIVPNIHQLDQIYSIYIFCRKPSKYQEWANDWSKVKSIVTEITSICDSVRQSARQCNEDLVTISAVSSLNKIEPSFMYTQLFKEILSEIEFDKNKEINTLAEYAREKYTGNGEHLMMIDEFVRDYQNDSNENKAIWWYTRECFTYHMLNKALGNLQVETLLNMGVFIRDLHQNITKLHFEQSNKAPTTTTITVYRGKTMSKQDFENKIKTDGLISFNNFLSTSDDQKVATRFITDALQSNNKNKIGVLFEMTIVRTISSTPFAAIHGISFFPTESEILFSMHTVFRVQQIKHIEENGIKLQQVKLTLTTDNDDQHLNALTQHIRDEITGTGWQRMGSLLWKMGENNKAEQVYTMLLDNATDDRDKYYCYNQLAIIKANQGEYPIAAGLYEKSLAVTENILPPNHPDFAASYNNIGSVYAKMGEHSKALSSYERSLEIQKTALPPNHPDFAASYNNIGVLYANMGEHSKALSSFERSLEIRKITLPPNHPDLAASYNNIGM
ncbi:unnamed protein product, partial [Didymodactylos carnosus]